MKKNNENAITLIALVVTIIGLLILAGVSISMLTGDNGVIGQANKSLIKTDNGRVLENVRLKITEYKGKINDEKITNRLEQLKSDGIIDDQGVVDCKKLIGQKLKTGNGSDNKDVYVIEEDELYYYDKNGNKDYLGNIGKDEEVSDEVDTSIFDITDDGVISIKKEYGYYDSGAHWENWALEELVIPTKVKGIKVKSIASEFLYYNSKIKKVHIPNSVTTIGMNAFYNCWLLEDVTIGENITNIGGGAFEGTEFLNNFSNGDVYIGNIYYEYKGEMPSGTTINIKDGTKCIADWAFYNHSELTSVTIPSSVTNIGSGAFCGCSSLTNITIGNGVTGIGYYAFYNCDNLTTVNYRGTQKQWNNITIESDGNNSLINATINFNYTGE